jgi:hypothetical protein
MQKKGELWMADWRDEHGPRKRKGFKMRRKADAVQNQMRANSGQIKKAHATGISCPVGRPSSAEGTLAILARMGR